MAPRGKAAYRPSIEIDGDILDPRNRFADDVGISEKTIGRRLKGQQRIIAGTAYIFRNAGKRELAGLVLAKMHGWNASEKPNISGDLKRGVRLNVTYTMEPQPQEENPT